jgi:hypothetical protein
MSATEGRVARLRSAAPQAVGVTVATPPSRVKPLGDDGFPNGRGRGAAVELHQGRRPRRRVFCLHAKEQMKCAVPFW